MTIKVGHFTLTGADTPTKVVTGVGFQPQLVEFFISFINADGIATGDQRYGYGAADGTREGAIGIGVGDAVAACTARRITTNTGVILVNDSVGNTTTKYSLASFDSDGFTLNASTAPTSGTYLVKYIAYNGLTNGYVDIIQLPSATGNFSSTNPGFQPDVTKWTSAASTSLDTSATNPLFSHGVAITSGTQFAVCSRFTSTGTSSGYAHGTVATDRVIVNVDNLGNDLAGSCSFVSHNANGYTGNKLVGSGQNYVIVVCIKGGGVWGLTTFNPQNSTGNFDVTTAGVDPTSVFTFAHNPSTASRTTFVPGHMSLGAIAGADQWSIERHSYDKAPLSGSSLTEEYTQTSSNRVFTNYARTGADTFTIIGDIAASSFGTAKVTFNQNDADPTNTLIGLLFVGTATGGGGGGDEALKRRYRHNHLGAIV